MPVCSPETCVCKGSSGSSSGNAEPAMAIASRTGHSENISDNDSDDVWGSSSDEANDNDVGDADHADAASRDLAALKRRHENRGYLDGLTKGGEAGLQTGFDSGYPLGAQLGGLVGELIADTVWRHSKGQIDDGTCEEALAELKISRVLSSEYFDSDLGMQNPRNHPLVAKWSHYYASLDRP